MSGFPEKLDCQGRDVILRPGRPDMRRGKISVRLSNDKVVLSYGRGVTLADIERFLRSEKVLKWISKTTDRSNGVMRGGNAVYTAKRRAYGRRKRSRTPRGIRRRCQTFVYKNAKADRCRKTAAADRIDGFETE